MLFVGIDLHKKTIAVCVVSQERTIVLRKTLLCAEPERARKFFAELGPFQAVVEATASYEWLWQLLEPLANRLVLAHPKKLRVIAESTRKTDRLDAQVLAEFLALDMIPAAYRPTPRQRQHRAWCASAAISAVGRPVPGSKFAGSWPTTMPTGLTCLPPKDWLPSTNCRSPPSTGSWSTN
jgi:hypothetical protein